MARGWPFSGATQAEYAANQRKDAQKVSGRSHGLGGCEFCELRADTRASSFCDASASFSETSRRNCAVRFSVSGATSSSKYLRKRVNSSSSLRPSSSNLSINTSRRNAGRISGIIETQKSRRKEGCWHFPTSGKCGCSVGRVCSVACLAARKSGRNCAPPVERSSAFMRRDATSAARICASRWRR